MKKLKLKNSLFAAFTVVALLFTDSQCLAQGDSTITRSFKQTFQMEADGLFDVNLQYSQLKVVNWDSSAVSIEGMVEALTADSAEAEEIFNLLTVDMYSSPLETGLSTRVDAEYKEREKQPFTITFTVKLPKSVGVLGRFDFCKVDVPTLSGPTDLKFNYTDLTADSLNFNKSEVAGKHSTTEISNFAGNMIASQYGTLKVGTITDSTEVINEYGTADINKLSNSCRWLKLVNDFGDIQITVSDSISYKMDVDSSYGTLIFPEEDEDMPLTDPAKETEWQATFGSAKEEAILKIDNEFGSITFTR
ncbi:hypothetical protein [Halocola ammonii]